MRQTLGSPVLAPTAGESRGLEWEAKGEGGGRRKGVKWGRREEVMERDKECGQSSGKGNGGRVA